MELLIKLSPYGIRPLVHIYSPEGLQHESDEIDNLFTQASNLLGKVEGMGINTESMRAEYDKSEAIWNDYQLLRGLEVKTILEEINQELGDWATVFDWFEAANQTILSAEQEGRSRDALIMKGKLKAAKEGLANQDLDRVKKYLEQITTLPEPHITSILITIVLLSALLRRRN